jgi:hydrogenase maturation protein HypF
VTNSSTNKGVHKGVEILIRGTVQGVGFRPFVYTLASRFGISGSVINTGDGVLIRAVGEDDNLSTFREALENEAPPLARITSISQGILTGEVEKGSFRILASIAGDSAKTVIPPDIALCADCLRELLDPHDHRYQYPFINCTNCGPRFTIVETIPYDRPKTSMKVFPMCPACMAEYRDPSNRRFHAQPNACPTCGPQLSLHDQKGLPIAAAHPIEEAARIVKESKVLALRGLGGFHLSVNGHSHEAVALLRTRKKRPDKPLAVMMPDIATVGKYCRVSAAEENLLLSPEHPIVLLGKLTGIPLADNLAPGLDELGVMLPYTPLHHLLFQEQDCPDTLVMTSGNAGGAPICTANDDALQRLAHLADFFLLHNREIVTRIDDSVTRIAAGRLQIFRRARGYVPAPLEIPWLLPATIGCGGGLKSTFSLARETSVFTSQHIGDLFNLESLDFYTESVDHLRRVFQIEPEIAACDLHPDYLSSRYAVELGLPLYRIQHHHAHAVAVMAEHRLSEPVLAIILDGTGYGPDGTIWGGEILLVELTGYQRLAHLAQLHLPGGDAAAHEPWRMAISALYSLAGADGLAQIPPALQAIPQGRREVIGTMLAQNFNSPLTSSCGRLFDAVASLLGIRQTISYEGQAAIELESLAKGIATSTWYTELPAAIDPRISALLCEKGEKLEICSTEFVKVVLDALARGDSIPSVALQFHYLLISSITELVRRLSTQTGIDQVVLSGGCMQNSLLLEGLFRSLKANNLQVYTGENIPINDGGISLGQTIIGGLQHVSRNSHEGYQS